MRTYSLSRTSRLYRFVFGNSGREIDGFPEPATQEMPLTLFLMLLVAAGFLRSFAFLWIRLLGFIVNATSLLADGTYFRGSLFKNGEEVQIRPWPHVFGRRLPPWICIVGAAILYQFVFVDGEAALKLLVYIVLFGAFMYFFGPTRSDGESLVEVLLDRHGQTMKQPLVKKYSSKALFSPTLRFTDE